MAVDRLNASEVSGATLEYLGLSESVSELISPEGLAESVRRAASFMSPITSGFLARAVAATVSGMPGTDYETSGQIQGVVESLVSLGDLVELPMDEGGGPRRHLFLGPPAYVPLADEWILLGIRPEGAPLVDERLNGMIRSEGSIRRMRRQDVDDAEDLLRAQELIELRAEQWFKAPRQTASEELVRSFDGRLDAAGPAGDIEGVTVVEPDSNVSYYRGRWRPLNAKDHGRFVGRRPQAFGNDLWCYMEVSGGETLKVLDFPVAPNLSGFDDAWRLQAAIDATRGRPQRLRVRSGASSEFLILDLFAPVPSWAQRRLDVVGHTVSRAQGALFSYAVKPGALEAEVEFLERMMWMFRKDHRG